MIKYFKSNLLIKDTVAYTFSVIFSRGLRILIFPLLVKSMSENDLINYDITLTNVMFAMTLCVFGVDSAVGRMLKDSKNHNDLLSASYFVIFIQTVITIIIFWGYIQISNIYIETYDFFIILILLFSLVVINQTTNTAKWLLERNKVITIQVLLGLLQSLLLFLLFFFEILNFRSAIISQMIGAAVIAIYSVNLLKVKFYPIKTYLLIKKILSNSLFLGINTIIVALYIPLEKNFIYQNISSYESATYLVHFKVALLFTFGMSALQISFTPHMIEFLKNNFYSKFKINLFYTSFLAITASIIYLFISPFFFNFFSDIHIFDNKLMIILILIQLVVLLNSFAEVCYVFYEKYRLILYLNLFQIISFFISCMLIEIKSTTQVTMIALFSLLIKLILMIFYNFKKLRKFSK